MKKVHVMKIVAAAAAVSLGALASASAAEVTVGADVNSAYVWRGITFNDGFVVQPSVDVAGPGGFGFNVWGNFDLDKYEVGGETVVDSGDFSEVDLTLSYAIPVEGFDLGIGLIEYLFPGAEGSTREVYVEAGYDLGSGFGIGAFVAYDFDEVDDVYGNISLTYGYEVDENLSFELGALIGAAGEDASAGEDSGLHEWQVSLSAAYALNDATELGAFIAYTDAVDDDVLADTDVNAYGGISLYYSF